MTTSQWDTFKRAARLEQLEQIPLALIIDSPWIPGYVGVSHLDFFLDPQVWFQSHLKIHREFPDIIFVLGWWLEYGMAAEPSVLLDQATTALRYVATHRSRTSVLAFEELPATLN